MPIPVSAPKGGDFTPAPEGLHHAVCVDVWPLWREKSTFPNDRGEFPMKTLTRIVWVLDEMMEDGRPFQVTKRYTASLHEKANLRKELESWRGRAFTEEELQSFDLEKLIGVNCQLQVVHNKGKQGGIFANVAAIVKLGKGMANLAVPQGFVRHKDKVAAGTAEDKTSNDDEDPF